MAQAILRIVSFLAFEYGPQVSYLSLAELSFLRRDTVSQSPSVAVSRASREYTAINKFIYVLSQMDYWVSLPILTQVLMEGVIGNGGGILQSLRKPCPGHLLIEPVIWIRPFEDK